MELDDPPQPTYQSFRLAGSSSPDDIVRIETVYHSKVRRQVVFREDIRQRFPDAFNIERGGNIVWFVKDHDFRSLQPRCYAAVPDVILDVVVRDPLIEPSTPSPPSAPSSFLDPPQSSITLPPLTKPSQKKPQDPAADKDSFISMPIEPSAPSPPSAPSSFLDPLLSPITLSPSVLSSFFDPLSSSITLSPSVKHSKKYLNPAADKDSFIRLPVYCDPESGLTGFTWDNHASIANPAVASTAATTTDTPDTQIQEAPPPSTTTTTAYGARLLSEAFSVARTNAGQGILSAMLDLGGFYYHGEGGALQDFSRAMRWFTQAAEDHGSAEAQYSIGTMHHQGHGVIHNFEAALEWYQKAAEQGHANAQYSIGLLYLNGEGVAQDFDIAMVWFFKSAFLGNNPAAQIAVGNMYFHGLGVLAEYTDAAERYIKAAERYIKAADQGSASAQANFGIMLLNGMGMSQDQRKAMEWLNRAAKGGDASAHRYLERNQYS